jgi:DNA polymerase IV
MELSPGGDGVHDLLYLVGQEEDEGYQPDRDDLAAWFGPTIGPRLRVLARGGSSRAITTEAWLARSKSRQVTFASDLTDPDDIGQEVAAIARELCAEIKADGRQVTHVGVTVRTRSFHAGQNRQAAGG